MKKGAAALLSIGVLIGTLLVIGVGQVITVRDERILTRGIDAHQFHRPLFGTYQQSQEIRLERPIEGVGALLVNFYRAAEITDVRLRIIAPESSQTLGEYVIPAHLIIDDRFATIHFSAPIGEPQQLLRFTFDAPDALGTAPLAIRYDTADAYPAGRSYSTTEVTEGDLAVSVVERVSLWQYGIRNIIENAQTVKLWCAALAAALGIALLSVAAQSWQRWPLKHQRHVQIGIILAIALSAYTARVAILPQYHGVSGGDPYNYIAISQRITKLVNPFAEQKRLPGYPLLLTPAYATNIDDQWWMRMIGLTSAAGLVVASALLARTMGLPWSAQIAVATLVAWQKDIWWNSFRPEPYTLYAFVVVTSLALFMRLRKAWQVYLCGLLLGYAAMTRQEGFVLALTLGLAAVLGGRYFLQSRALVQRNNLAWQQRLLRWWQTRQGYWRLVIPALMLVLPFFIHNATTYGNPFFTPYFEGDRLQIVDSWQAFVDSTAATWGILASMWWHQWDQLYRVTWTEPAFLIGFAATLTWWLLWQHRRVAASSTWHWLQVGLGLILITTVSWVYFTTLPSLMTTIRAATAGALAASLIALLFATRWRGLLVITVIVSQGLIATWFHPFPKHYQQIYPLLLLAFATLLVLDRQSVNHSLRRVAALFISRTAVFLPLALVVALLQVSQYSEIDQYNQATALDHVLYQAVQYAQTAPRPVAFDEGYIQARVYYDGDDHVYYYNNPDEPNVSDERAWLERHAVATLVVTNNSPAFTTPDPTWKLVRSWRTEGRDEQVIESRVYILPDR